MSIDLRGVGEAVRAAAAGRRQTVAAFARDALVAAAGSLPSPTKRGEPRSRGMTKLHLRMGDLEAEALVVNARLLGLSYGDYVGRLVVGTPLPAPVAQRDAVRAALRQSCDQLAVLGGDINAVIRLIYLGRPADAANEYGESMRRLEVEVRRHIDLASRLLATLEDTR
ncbi:hypothetical protein [Ramlibacter sp. AN1133]|uniref:hypothetical protein n=1 Tax=Ramlibacter sp. AN1133 TaxID=3133429 RepID=UPI0030C0F460